MTNFVDGGYEEYVRYLRESHEARMQKLRQELAKAAGDEVLRLQRVIRQERDDHECRVSRAGDCEY
jgi:hypothetical protein